MRFQVLKVTSMKMVVFWAQRNPVVVYRRFRGTWYIHHQGNKWWTLNFYQTSGAKTQKTGIFKTNLVLFAQYIFKHYETSITLRPGKVPNLVPRVWHVLVCLGDHTPRGTVWRNVEWLLEEENEKNSKKRRYSVTLSITN